MRSVVNVESVFVLALPVQLLRHIRASIRQRLDLFVQMSIIFVRVLSFVERRLLLFVFQKEQTRSFDSTSSGWLFLRLVEARSRRAR